MIQEGTYTADQIAQMGLNFNETTSAQQAGGAWYKLDNTGNGMRSVKSVQPVGSGQGSGGFTYGSPATGTGANLTSLTGSTTPDLTALYKNLYSSSGISDLESQLTNIKNSYASATSNINDNPFLSEASRVGRIQKLTTDYNNSILPLTEQITGKKSDVETQLNLATKQIDINSAAVTQALNVYNTLLSSGALDNASANDIATIASQTGLSTSMIQSAVSANKSKNVQTQTISYDDGTNQGYAVINSQTGEIISKQVVAASKPEKKSGGLTDTQSRSISASAALILSEVDSQYRVNKSGQAVKLQYKEDYSGDTKLSLEEYKLAIRKLIEQTGITTEQADEYLTNQMKQLGYSKWKW